MTDKAPDDIAAQRYIASLTRSMERNNLTGVAASAFIQANVSHAVVNALVQMLKQKNIISPAELEKALADAYNQSAAAVDNQSIVIAAPAPTVNGRN